MKAIAKIQPGKGASLIEIPVPKPIDNEVLIKVESCAICGGDFHLYNWEHSAVSCYQSDIPFPILMGHELGGNGC